MDSQPQETKSENNVNHSDSVTDSQMDMDSQPQEAKNENNENHLDDSEYFKEILTSNVMLHDIVQEGIEDIKGSLKTMTYDFSVICFIFKIASSMSFRTKTILFNWQFGKTFENKTSNHLRCQRWERGVVGGGG